MSAALKVVRPGLFDTLQDLGRIGFMALGMPTAGAMDRVALRLANALCDNPAGTAKSRSRAGGLTATSISASARFTFPSCPSPPTAARSM